MPTNTLQPVEVSTRVASQVLLLAQWDLEDDNSASQYKFSVRYYGTAYESRAVQLAECLDRASIVASPHVAVRLPDGNWITGAVKS